MQFKECIISPLGYSCINRFQINLNQLNSNILTYILLRSIECTIKNIIKNYNNSNIHFNISDYPALSFN